MIGVVSVAGIKLSAWLTGDTFLIFIAWIWLGPLVGFIIGYTGGKRRRPWLLIEGLLGTGIGLGLVEIVARTAWPNTSGIAN